MAYASERAVAVEAVLAASRVCVAVQQRLVAGSPWLAMELASGGPLSAIAGRLTWPQLRHVLLVALDALAHAHARAVVHRDLKPANILLHLFAELLELLVGGELLVEVERARRAARGHRDGDALRAVDEQVGASSWSSSRL